MTFSCLENNVFFFCRFWGDTMFFARLYCWRVPCSLKVIKCAAVAHNVVDAKCLCVLVTEQHGSNFFRTLRNTKPTKYSGGLLGKQN